MDIASVSARWRGRSSPLSNSHHQCKERKQSRPVIPGRASAPDPELRDSGFDASHRPRNDGGDGSTLLRRNIPQSRRMRRNILDAVLQMHALVRRQLLGDANTRPPLGRRAGSVAAQNRRRSSGRHYAACCPRNPRRTCIRRNRSARPQHSAAGPCRNIRSSAGVAAPSSPRNVILSGSSQIGRKTRMTDFPRFGPCYDRSGNLALSFSRSSTIDERTWATLWCGISTSLTRPERSLRSRSTTFKT